MAKGLHPGFEEVLPVFVRVVGGMYTIVPKWPSKLDVRI